MRTEGPNYTAGFEFFKYLMRDENQFIRNATHDISHVLNTIGIQLDKNDAEIIRSCAKLIDERQIEGPTKIYFITDICENLKSNYRL